MSFGEERRYSRSPYIQAVTSAPSVSKSHALPKAAPKDFLPTQVNASVIKELCFKGEYDTVLGLFDKHKEKFDQILLSVMFHSFGKAKLKRIHSFISDARFQIFVEHVTSKMNVTGFFGTRAMSNIIQAVAKLKINAPELIELVASKVEWLVDTGNTQEIAITMLAFATLKHEIPHVIKPITQKAEWIISNGKPDEIANIAWASAVMDKYIPLFMVAIEKNAAFIVAEGKSKDVRKIIWAFATLRHPTSQLLKEIENKVEWLVADADSDEIESLIWAFETMKASSLHEAVNKRYQR